MSRFPLVLLVCCLMFGCQVTAQTISPNDLKPLTGDRWHGILTYKDYQSGKEVQLPAELTVTQSATNPLQWEFQTDYPTEKHASGKQTITLSKDGRQLDKETVMERISRPGKVLQIITQEEATDNDLKATLRYTYEIGKKEFSILKEVRTEDSPDFRFRNRYHYQR